MNKSEKSNLARYRKLLARTLFDLKLTRDLADAMKLPGNRIGRLARARIVLTDEQIEASREGVKKDEQKTTAR
jgi:hypothetical protein